MKASLVLSSLVCVVAVSGQVAAQEPARGIVPVTERVFEAHRMMREVGRVEEGKGWLIADPAAGQLRFEADGQPMFTVSYGRLTALHYERDRGPSKWGWPVKDTRHYMTVHYADPDGRPMFETVCVPGPDVPFLLDMLEQGSGLLIDRAPAKQSFLGVPIRATIGDRVAVTDEAGNVVKGTIAELSPTALALDGPMGVRHVFEGRTVDTIKRTRSRGRGALRGFAMMAIPAAITAGLVEASVGADIASSFRAAALVGVMFGGPGALGGALIPSYKERTTRDIYIRPPVASAP